MNPHEINKRIAIACGWTEIHDEVKPAVTYTWGTPPNSFHRDLLPSYHSDLNAMHEAENCLLVGASSIVKETWLFHLRRLSTIGATSSECATAPQRSETFLRTIGQWEDGCCSEYGETWSVDGVEVAHGPCDDNRFQQLLKHLGYNARIVNENEDGEEICEL